MIIDMRLRTAPGFYETTGKSFGKSEIPSVVHRSTAMCVEEMDAAGVTHGVIMGRMAQGRRGSVSNDEIAEVCQRFPGRFIPFAGIDLSGEDMSAALQELDRCILSLGFAGVSLEPCLATPAKHVDDPTLMPMYARCEALGVPVSLSMSVMVADHLDLRYCDPTPVQRVSQRFPNLQLILSHACWPWVDQAVGVALACRNVYLSLDFYVTMRMPGHLSFVEAANSLLSERTLFGTAYPSGLPFDETLKRWRELPFSAQALAKTLGENAARLLKLT